MTGRVTYGLPLNLLLSLVAVAAGTAAVVVVILLATDALN
jgi:hypothetical protein